jgi:hypothetical protein
MTAQLNELSKVTQKMISNHVIQGINRKGNNSVFVAGLTYILDKNYFDDAFILHVESEGHKQFSEIIFNLMKDNTYET